MGTDSLVPWCSTCGKDISWGQYNKTKQAGGECKACEEWWASQAFDEKEDYEAIYEWGGQDWNP